MSQYVINWKYECRDMPRANCTGVEEGQIFERLSLAVGYILSHSVPETFKDYQKAWGDSAGNITFGYDETEDNWYVAAYKENDDEPFVLTRFAVCDMNPEED